MAMDDLFKALTMFKQGVGELQLSRAIQGANEQVGQLKASDMDYAQQRAAMQEISNQLVARMASVGAPATTIAQVAGAIGPKSFANSGQMFAEAQTTGDRNLAGMAQKQQEFEQNPKYTLQAMKMAEATNPLAKMKHEEAAGQFRIKAFERFSKTIDPNAEVRSAFGRAALGLQAGNKLEMLVGKAATDLKQANELPPQMVAELATGLASMVKGGAATIADIDHFLPKTLGMDAAQLKQYVTNGVQGAEAGKFVQLYTKTVARERAEAQLEVNETVLNRAQGNMSLYKEDPDLFKRTLADRLNIPVEDVVVDEKKRLVTTRQKVETTERFNSTAAVVKKAYKAYKSGKADGDVTPENAPMIFQSLGINPEDVPLNQAITDLRFRITRGLM